MVRAVEPLPDARVPRQDRSRLTQRRILDAGVEELAESGYEGFTTSRVSSRAGVSKGALFGHFPTREVLLAATLKHLTSRQREQFANKMSDELRGSGADFVHEGLALLWDYVTDPAYRSLLEVYCVARTNEAVRAAIEPGAQRGWKETHAMGCTLLASLGVPEERAPGLVTLVFGALEGLALDTVTGDAVPGAHAQAMDYLEQLVVSAIVE